MTVPTHQPDAPGDTARPGEAGGRMPGLGVLGLAGVTLLTVLVVWSAVFAGPWNATYSETSEEAPPSLIFDLEETGSSPLDGVDLEGYGDARGVVVGVLVVIALVVLAAATFLLVKQLSRWSAERRTRSLGEADANALTGDAVAAGDVQPDVAELREGVAEAWARLSEGREPTDAVTAAWVALEEAADRSGVPRDAAATPTEFTVAVLDRTQVEPSAIRTLLSLYHRARFSTHGATRQDVDLAGQCLTTLADGLTQ